MPIVSGFDPNGYIITQSFQNVAGHTGVDLATRNNTPGGIIRAIGAGRVVYRQEKLDPKGWGYMVRIEHRLPSGQLIYSQYAHLSADSFQVTCGDSVAAGTPIGTVGSTGHSTNPHLHFEVKVIDTNGCGYLPSSNCSGDNFANYRSPLRFIEDSRGNFDFAMGFLAVDGNIDFFDNFNDGSLTTFPTSEFFSSSPVSESGGFLHLRSSDGANNFTPGVLTDNVHLGLQTGTTRLKDGGGNSVITASFRADIPPQGQGYGLQLYTFGTNEIVNIQVGSCGASACVTGLYTGPPLVTKTVPISLSGVQFIIFRLVLNDTTNQVAPSFSINGGATFTEIALPTPGRIFSSNNQAIVSVFGFTEVP
ncbi:MAG: M23 family metallopeptidase [Candidatus Binatia bacterium]